MSIKFAPYLLWRAKGPYDQESQASNELWTEDTEKQFNKPRNRNLKSDR